MVRCDVYACSMGLAADEVVCSPDVHLVYCHYCVDEYDGTSSALNCGSCGCRSSYWSSMWCPVVVCIWTEAMMLHPALDRLMWCVSACVVCWGALALATSLVCLDALTVVRVVCVAHVLSSCVGTETSEH